MKTIPLETQYFALVLESEFVAGILDNKTLQTQHKILRVHNDESRLHKALALDASGLLEKILFYIESVKLRRYSAKVIKQCDQLWFISDQEMEQFSRPEQYRLQGKVAHHLPMIVDAKSIRTSRLNSSSVFYAGALSVPTNQNSLIWYLENVHPRMVDFAGYELIIAGQTGQANIDRLLNRIRTTTHIRFYPDMKDLDGFYNTSAAFINPLQRGAGVKIKTIDAAAAGLPIVTTTPGAEGTGFIAGQHLIIADNPKEFAAGLKLVLHDKNFARELVTASQQLLRKNNTAHQLQILLSDLERRNTYCQST